MSNFTLGLEFDDVDDKSKVYTSKIKMQDLLYNGIHNRLLAEKDYEQYLNLLSELTVAKNT
jgi:hypothetical protein